MDNRQGTTISLAGGLGLTILSLAVPHYFPNLSSVAWNVLTGVGIVMFVVACAALIIRKRAPVSPKLALDSARGPDLSIVIAHGGHYEHVKTNLYTLTRTVSVGVKNAGGVLLSNCKLFCEITDGTVNPNKKWLLENTFTLTIGEERYVTVASYNERIPPHQTAGRVIQLHAPVGSGYGGFLPTFTAEMGGVMTMTAHSAESRPCEVICRFWVKDGKLNWEQA